MTAPALNQLWQSLPTVLEDAAIRADKAVHALANERAARQDWPDEAKAELAVARQQAAAHQDRLDDALTRLRAARVESAARETRIAEIMASASWRLTSPLRFAGRYLQKPGRGKMINLERIVHHQIATDPYRWAAIDDLFSPPDAMALARTYPCDHFKLVAASGGEKDYEYEARGLIGMGANFITYPDDLSDAWQTLAGELLSPEYRDAMVTLTGCDLTQALMEVNVFHYGPGGTLGAHCDLPEKLLTHVLYFNRSWNSADGGCLSILRSSDPADLVAEIPPNRRLFSRHSEIGELVARRLARGQRLRLFETQRDRDVLSSRFDELDVAPR